MCNPGKEIIPKIKQNENTISSFVFFFLFYQMLFDHFLLITVLVVVVTGNDGDTVEPKEGGVGCITTRIRSGQRTFEELVPLLTIRGLLLGAKS